VDAAKQPPKESNSSDDGPPSNGHGKKPDDTPQITEPPDSILSFFKSEQSLNLLNPSELVSSQTHMPDSREPLKKRGRSMRFYISPPWHRRQETCLASQWLLTARTGTANIFYLYQTLQRCFNHPYQQARCGRSGGFIGIVPDGAFVAGPTYKDSTCWCHRYGQRDWCQVDKD
jgi:hypothetical protein